METKELTTSTRPIMNPISISTQTMDVMEIGKLLAQSGYFKDVKDMAQAVAKILAGRELGIGPIASLQQVYINQQGKVCYSANAIAAAIKGTRRYNFKIRKLDNTGCLLDFYEGAEKMGESSFTIEDAKTAGLTEGPNKQNWRSYPRNMLFARALTNGAKWYCPDVGGGIPLYTPEELGATVNVDGEVLTDPRALGLAPQAALTEPEQPQQAISITYPQQKRLFALAKEAGVDVDLLKRYMLAILKTESTKQLSQEAYTGLCSDLENGLVLGWWETQQEREPEEEGVGGFTLTDEITDVGEVA